MGYLRKGVILALTHFLFFFLRGVYKAASFTRVGELPYLRARVTLVGGLTFSLVNTPGRVNLCVQVNCRIVSRTFECKSAFPGCRVTLLVKFFRKPELSSSSEIQELLIGTMRPE